MSRDEAAAVLGPADPAPEVTERVARALASRHYSMRFNLPPHHPQVVSNVHGNWITFHEQASVAIEAMNLQPPHDQGHPHLIDGKFQSDKYPSTPRGKVPLSVKDAGAQDLLWQYAQRRRRMDGAFSTDLEIALIMEGFVAPHDADCRTRCEKQDMHKHDCTCRIRDLNFGGAVADGR